MIKTADLLKDTSTEALDFVHTALHKDTLDEQDALKLYVWTERLSTFLALMRDKLRAPANAAFAQLKIATPHQTSWPVANFAIVSDVKPAVTWIYPANLVAAEATLRGQKELAKINKTATATTLPADHETVPVFVVDLRTI